MHIAARTLRRDFGWNVTVNGDTVTLTLSAAVAAVVLTSQSLRRIRNQIELWGDPCVAVKIPGSGSVSMMLADARDHVPGAENLPPCVRMVSSEHELVLPPSLTSSGRVRWLHKPDRSRRWLPSVATVLCAARQLQP